MIVYLIIFSICLMTIVVAQSILIIIVVGIGKLNPAEEIGMIQCSVDYPKIILINMKIPSLTEVAPQHTQNLKVDWMNRRTDPT